MWKGELAGNRVHGTWRTRNATLNFDGRTVQTIGPNAVVEFDGATSTFAALDSLTANSGTLYGTTAGGGTIGDGVVFSLTKK